MAERVAECYSCDMESYTDSDDNGDVDPGALFDSHLLMSPLTPFVLFCFLHVCCRLLAGLRCRMGVEFEL